MSISAPPSTGSATPVMKFASSDARNNAAFATSQGVPILWRSGTRASRAAATSARLLPLTRARVSTALPTLWRRLPARPPHLQNHSLGAAVVLGWYAFVEWSDPGNFPSARTPSNKCSRKYCHAAISMAFFKRKVPSDNVAAVRKTLTRRFDFLVTTAAAALNITDDIVACVVRGETPRSLPRSRVSREIRAA